MTGFDIYLIILVLSILFQAIMMYQCYRITTFSLKYIQKLPQNTPHNALLVCPCKGIDTAFAKNISSMLKQGHNCYRVVFAVEDELDPAYEMLKSIIEKEKPNTTALSVDIVVAGHAVNNSQKVHNLLAAIETAPEEIELLAFVDSDGYLKPEFLHALGSQLRRTDRNIASTGYRWFVPEDNRLSSYMLSVLNAPFAGSLGDHRMNSTWGGAMAILKSNFYELGIDKIWQGALSDDYTMTWAVKKKTRGYVHYNPHCLLPSFEKSSWQNLFSFARRQFIITRCCLPLFWWMALGGLANYLLCFWGGLGLLAYAIKMDSPEKYHYLWLPVITYLGGIIRGICRQYVTSEILYKWRKRLKIPAIIDIFCQPICNALLALIILSTSFSRSIVWREKKYSILGIDKTKIE